jgi:hypothetical protein
MKIKEQMRNLLDTIEAGLDWPADVRTAIAAAPPVGTHPVPQITWAWLGFFHYLEQKRWAQRVVEENVPPLPPDHWRVRSRGSPQYDYEGLCPNHPEWEFSRVGGCYCLVHRLTGAKIHLDFSRGLESIDGRDLDAYYRVSHPTTDIQLRLQERFPCHSLWFHPLLALRSAGLLGGEGACFTPLPEGRRHVECATHFLDTFAKSDDRLWLAVVIGDWPWACKLARTERPDLLEELAPNEFPALSC